MGLLLGSPFKADGHESSKFVDARFDLRRGTIREGLWMAKQRANGFMHLESGCAGHLSDLVYNRILRRIEVDYYPLEKIL